METVARFERVSWAQFEKDSQGFEGAKDAYEQLIQPRRATAGSAGYDFVAPFGIDLGAGETCRMPTGFRAWIAPGWALLLFPRSGLGFRYGMRLGNTVGVVDSDYYLAENQGHIQVQFTAQAPLRLNRGDRFCQGIFLPYGLAQEEAVTHGRTGGFGSTGR